MTTATIVSILFALVLCGVFLWLLSVITMDETIKMIVRAMAILFVVWWLLSRLGVPGVPHIGG